MSGVGVGYVEHHHGRISTEGLASARLDELGQREAGQRLGAAHDVVVVDGILTRQINQGEGCTHGKSVLEIQNGLGMLVGACGCEDEGHRSVLTDGDVQLRAAQYVGIEMAVGLDVGLPIALGHLADHGEQHHSADAVEIHPVGGIVQHLGADRDQGIGRQTAVAGHVLPGGYVVISSVGMGGQLNGSHGGAVEEEVSTVMHHKGVHEGLRGILQHALQHREFRRQMHGEYDLGASPHAVAVGQLMGTDDQGLSRLHGHVHPDKAVGVTQRIVTVHMGDGSVVGHAGASVGAVHHRVHVGLIGGRSRDADIQHGDLVGTAGQSLVGMVGIATCAAVLIFHDDTQGADLVGSAKQKRNELGDIFLIHTLDLVVEHIGPGGGAGEEGQSGIDLDHSVLVGNSAPRADTRSQIDGCIVVQIPAPDQHSLGHIHLAEHLRGNEGEDPGRIHQGSRNLTLDKDGLVFAQHILQRGQRNDILDTVSVDIHLEVEENAVRLEFTHDDNRNTFDPVRVQGDVLARHGNATIVFITGMIVVIQTPALEAESGTQGGRKLKVVSVQTRNRRDHLIRVGDEGDGEGSLVPLGVDRQVVGGHLGQIEQGIPARIAPPCVSKFVTVFGSSLHVREHDLGLVQELQGLGLTAVIVVHECDGIAVTNIDGINDLVIGGSGLGHGRHIRGGREVEVGPLAGKALGIREGGQILGQDEALSEDILTGRVGGQHVSVEIHRYEGDGIGSADLQVVVPGMLGVVLGSAKLGVARAEHHAAIPLIALCRALIQQLAAANVNGSAVGIQGVSVATVACGSRNDTVADGIVHVFGTDGTADAVDAVGIGGDGRCRDDQAVGRCRNSSACIHNTVGVAVFTGCVDIAGQQEKLTCVVHAVGASVSGDSRNGGLIHHGGGMICGYKIAVCTSFLCDRMDHEALGEGAGGIHVVQRVGVTRGGVSRNRGSGGGAIGLQHAALHGVGVSALSIDRNRRVIVYRDGLVGIANTNRAFGSVGLHVALQVQIIGTIQAHGILTGGAHAGVGIPRHDHVGGFDPNTQSRALRSGGGNVEIDIVAHPVRINTGGISVLGDSSYRIDLRYALIFVSIQLVGGSDTHGISVFALGIDVGHAVRNQIEALSAVNTHGGSVYGYGGDIRYVRAANLDRTVGTKGRRVIFSFCRHAGIGDQVVGRRHGITRNFLQNTRRITARGVDRKVSAAQEDGGVIRAPDAYSITVLRADGNGNGIASRRAGRRVRRADIQLGVPLQADGRDVPVGRYVQGGGILGVAVIHVEHRLVNQEQIRVGTEGDTRKVQLNVVIVVRLNDHGLLHEYILIHNVLVAAKLDHGCVGSGGRLLGQRGLCRLREVVVVGEQRAIVGIYLCDVFHGQIVGVDHQITLGHKIIGMGHAVFVRPIPGHVGVELADDIGGSVGIDHRLGMLVGALGQEGLLVEYTVLLVGGVGRILYLLSFPAGCHEGDGIGVDLVCDLVKDIHAHHALGNVPDLHLSAGDTVIAVCGVAHHGGDSDHVGVTHIQGVFLEVVIVYAVAVLVDHLHALGQQAEVRGVVLSLLKEVADRHVEFHGLPLGVELGDERPLHGGLIRYLVFEAGIGIPAHEFVAESHGNGKSVAVGGDVVAVDIAELNLQAVFTVQDGARKIEAQRRPVGTGVCLVGIVAVLQLNIVQIGFVVDLHDGAGASLHGAVDAEGIAPHLAVLQRGVSGVSVHQGRGYVIGLVLPQGSVHSCTGDLPTVGIQVHDDQLIVGVQIFDGHEYVFIPHSTADHEGIAQGFPVHDGAVGHVIFQRRRGDRIGLAIFQNSLVGGRDGHALSVHVVDGEQILVFVVGTNHPDVPSGHGVGGLAVIGLPFPGEGVAFPLGSGKGVHPGVVDVNARLVFLHVFPADPVLQGIHVMQLIGPCDGLGSNGEGG